MSTGRFTRKDYTVGWISALPLELEAGAALLDERHPDLERRPHDSNSYVLGRIGKYNVVMACLPDGDIGTNSAAFVAAQMMGSFPFIRIRLMVGIGGGVPEPNDVRLGDVVVSVPNSKNRGVVQHDFGKIETGGNLRHTRVLNGPPPLLLGALSRLRISRSLQDELASYLSRINEVDSKFAYPGAKYDQLFEASYAHETPGASCEQCDTMKLVKERSGGDRNSTSPVIHYGVIASGNQVILDASTRDRLAKEHNALCFDMEAAGLMNNFPCLIIRGISDYSDSHRNNRWKDYAGATAAAYAKAFLNSIPPEESESIAKEAGSVRNTKT